MSFISAIKRKISSHRGLKRAKRCIQCKRYYPVDQLYGGLCLNCINKLSDENG